MKFFTVTILISTFSIFARRPERVFTTAMALSSTITESLKSSALIAIDIDVKKETVETQENEITVSDAISKHAGARGSLCYVVRRPG